MRRGDFLYTAGIEAQRFKLLEHRGQLPFETRSAEDAHKWVDYKLDWAFQTRLMLDLVGNEPSSGDQLQGLGPAYAAEVVRNAMRQFPRHPLNQIEPLDWWVGVVVYQEEDAEGRQRRYPEWFAGELHCLSSWVEERGTRKDGGRKPAARIFLANATRAAQFVQDRALEVGMPEEDVFAEVGREGA